MEPMSNRARRAVAILAALSTVASACGGSSVSEVATTSTTAPPATVTTAPPATVSTAPPATSTTTTFVSAEVTVTGVVIAVEGGLGGIDFFVVRLEDGTDLTLVPVEGLLFDEVGPLSHVRDHLVSGSPVRITYETSVEGSATATVIGDAGGESHEHDD